MGDCCTCGRATASNDFRLGDFFPSSPKKRFFSFEEPAEGIDFECPLRLSKVFLLFYFCLNLFNKKKL